MIKKIGHVIPVIHVIYKVLDQGQDHPPCNSCNLCNLCCLKTFQKKIGHVIHVIHVIPKIYDQGQEQPLEIHVIYVIWVI